MPDSFAKLPSQIEAEILQRLLEVGGHCTTSIASRRAVNTRPFYAALRRMEGRGLVDCRQTGYWPLWGITEAGENALARYLDKFGTTRPVVTSRSEARAS